MRSFSSLLDGMAVASRICFPGVQDGIYLLRGDLARGGDGVHGARDVGAELPHKSGGLGADRTKTTVCYGIHRRVRPEPRLPGYKPLVFPCGMYSAFPELRRKPLKSYRISCFRVVAARGACYNNGENQPNSVKKSASKPMTDHGRHALWFPLGVKQISRKIFVKGRTKRV